MTTPIQIYHRHLASEQYTPDPAQATIVNKLQSLYDQFVAAHATPSSRWRIRFRQRRKQPVKGLYLWGSVGAGKTWLMDIFYHSLPTTKKRRVHFHRFMKEIHAELKRLQGVSDPLKLVAYHLAEHTKILCFDEFFVTDITDAMLLGNLLEALFQEGITFVATSNVAPDDLYRNGLQRARFLPAIALIKQHTEIVHVVSNMDYRLRELVQAGVFYYPHNAKTTQQLQRHFEHFANGQATFGKSLYIEGREIKTVGHANNVVWFDFNILCREPRSQLDYLEIARCYNTVLLSNVPQIQAVQDNLASYFIKLIDVFYDARVKLILSAAVPVPEIYTSGRLAFEFQRTQSRLLEMQSIEYLQQKHGESICS